MKGLTTHTALELAALVRHGEVSCREVVEAHLARIDDVNESVNAITVTLRDSALAAADAADSAPSDKPLRGVPFTIKESIDRVGSATTYGVPALSRQMPRTDAPVVARMKAAGAIPIGRTNLSEMGMRLSTDNPLWGPTLNPWLPEVTAGGSSGGDAAALATGMTPLGLGNDLGGSLRSPAYCCGIAALKPTTGRVPHASSIEPRDSGMAMQAMLVQGPMARSVADLRLCLSILAGRDIRDPRSVDAPLTGPSPLHLRAALVTNIPDANLPGSTLAAIRHAGRILEDEGWTVEEATPPEIEHAGEVWGELLATDLSVLLPRIGPMLTPALYDYLLQMCERFDSRRTPNAFIHAERSRLGRLWSAFLTDYPIAIGPTWARLPWPPDADLDPVTGLDLVADTARFLTPGNLLGLPAVALPMGLVDGLPTGIQIYADLWREDLCLSAAQLIEARVARHTPIDPLGFY